MSRTRVLLLLLLCWVVATVGCAKRVHRRQAVPAELETLDGNAPFLKAHMRDGRLFVLAEWSVDSANGRVRGTGKGFGADRGVVRDGPHVISLDSVALFETNTVRVSGAVAPLAVMTGISVGVTAYCIANPKACFGSCPTFYLSDGERELLQAEGFSASVAPSLEATDIDALYRLRPSAGRQVEMRMRNEALETHVVRSVNLLALPRPPGHRVFVDRAGTFWAANDLRHPISCAGGGGECLDAVREFDGVERFVPADSTDLATREVVDLTFAPLPEGRPALVIASRQSLLPTFLLYQTFAYMGSSVGEWLAAFERSDPATQQRTSRLIETLGGIEVLAQDADGVWIPVGTVLETGPLAADVRVVHLPATDDSMQVRLRMAKGAWRIDYVAVASVGATIEPVRLVPSEVRTVAGTDPEALARLTDANRVLVTMPGDEYALHYALPADAEGYELFLEATGYYLEWMREEWIAEEDRLAAMQLFVDPAGALKALAPKFKQIEPDLERTFWSSKYVLP